jgi:preprotein translocase subunit YajC
MQLINNAFAGASVTNEAPAIQTTTGVPAVTGPVVPSQGDALMMNIGMVLVLGVLFYLLLIRPQQKRFKEHASMINTLDHGTKVVTQGGLVGTIDKVVSDHEVIIDFGNSVKMTMMRSYILGRYEDSLPNAKKAANDTSKQKDKNSK